MRIATWCPLTPKEVLQPADKPDLQLVTSSRDLCQVLVAALEKYDAALRGTETPVRDLWDRQGSRKVFRPIDEPALSDVVLRTRTFSVSQMKDGPWLVVDETKGGRLVQPVRREMSRS
jgi:hypothetical protein